MGFGDRVRILREEKGLTQKQLGQLLGVTRVTISGYENNIENVAGIKTLITLTELFDVPADYLLGLTDCREKYPVAEPVTAVNIDAVMKMLSNSSQKTLIEYVKVLRKRDSGKE